MGRLAWRAGLWVVVSAALVLALAGGCGLDRGGARPDDGSSTGVGAAGGADPCPSCPNGSVCEQVICIDECSLAALPEGTPCTGPGGQVCSAAGECVECITNMQCLDGQICDQSFCVPEQCVNDVMDGDETGVDCGGSCAPCGNGEGCADADDCLSGFCDGVTCAPCDSHDDCPGDWCDNGTCALDKGDGVACVDDEECTSTFCADGVCCAAACDGGCDQCNAIVGTCTLADDNTAGDGTCAPFLCDGASGVCPAACVDNADCVAAGFCEIDGDPDVCQPLKIVLGAACDHAEECDSGFCVDGVCCASLCDSLCDACALAKTGQPNGSCAAVTAMTDPDAECANGSCNGSMDCDVDQGQPCPGGNTDCLNNTCRDGFCCNNACGTLCESCAAAHTGGTNGVCSAVTPNTDPAMECANGRCNGSNDCDLDQGQACPGGDTDCLNGICRDGFCCEDTCTGECRACSNAKTGSANGVCDDILADTDPDGECPGGNDCDGSGCE